MKACFFFTAILLLCCIACKKEQNPEIKIDPPDDPASQVVLVTELGTGLPIAGAEVNLFEKLYTSYYPPAYVFVDSLGLTNEQGVLYWERDGEPLPIGGVLMFEHPDYYASDDNYVYLSAQEHPGDTIRGALHPPGYVRFQFRLTPDTLLRRFVVYDVPPGALSSLFAYHLYSTPLSTSLDMTVAVQVKGHANHRFYMVVLPENADYINVWPTLHTQDTTVFCPARDTAFVEAFF